MPSVQVLIEVYACALGLYMMISWSWEAIVGMIGGQKGRSGQRKIINVIVVVLKSSNSATSFMENVSFYPPMAISSWTL